jgi:hypothetical protein
VFNRPQSLADWVLLAVFCAAFAVMIFEVLWWSTGHY